MAFFAKIRRFILYHIFLNCLKELLLRHCISDVSYTFPKIKVLSEMVLRSRRHTSIPTDVKMIQGKWHFLNSFFVFTSQ